MTGLLSRDVPPRAAFTVVALALLATLVAGREEPLGQAASPRESTRGAAAARSEPAPLIVPEDLDLERLKRARKEGTMPELFVARAWESTPPPQPSAPVVQSKPASPPPPATPSAPPLPFRYLGHSADGERTIVYLAIGETARIASVGDTIENIYKLDEIGASALTFTYLPLGTKQTLSIPGRRQGASP